MKKTIITLFVVVMMLQISVIKNTVYADVHGKNNGPHRGACEVFDGVTICYADDSKEIIDKYRAEQEAKQNNGHLFIDTESHIIDGDYAKPQ